MVSADAARTFQVQAPKKPDSQRCILTKTTPADQGLVKLPALTSHLKYHLIGEQQTLLVSESFNTLMHGELICDLLPLLNGQRWLDEIVVSLEERHAAADVRAAVVSLSAKGYVVSADHGMNQSRAAYWSSLGASPRWVEKRLAESRIAVVDGDDRLVWHLQESGTGVGFDDPKLTVIVCDDYLEERLAEINRHQLESRAPWMLVRPCGIEPLFGPIFRGDQEGPCWACLAYRLRSHQEVHNFLRNFAGEEAAFKPFASNPEVLEALRGLIAAEIVKWLVLEAAAPIHETRDHDEYRHFCKFATSGVASAAVHGMRRRNVASAGSDARCLVSDIEPESPSQQRRRTRLGPASHASTIPPSGKPDQWCCDMVVAHHRRDRFLVACLLGRKQSRHAEP